MIMKYDMIIKLMITICSLSICQMQKIDLIWLLVSLKIYH